MNDARASTADFPAVQEAGRAASAQMQFYHHMMASAPLGTPTASTAHFPAVLEAGHAARIQMERCQRLLET